MRDIYSSKSEMWPLTNVSLKWFKVNWLRMEPIMSLCWYSMVKLLTSKFRVVRFALLTSATNPSKFRFPNFVFQSIVSIDWFHWLDLLSLIGTVKYHVALYWNQKDLQHSLDSVVMWNRRIRFHFEALLVYCLRLINYCLSWISTLELCLTYMITSSSSSELESRMQTSSSSVINWRTSLVSLKV